MNEKSPEACVNCLEDIENLDEAVPIRIQAGPGEFKTIWQRWLCTNCQGQDEPMLQYVRFALS